MFETIFGSIIQNAIGVISVVSCFTFVIMCNFDWSGWDDCCAAILLEFVEYSEVPEDRYNDTIGKCNPKCNEFFYSRMPIYFEWSE